MPSSNGVPTILPQNARRRRVTPGKKVTYDFRKSMAARGPQLGKEFRERTKNPDKATEEACSIQLNDTDTQ